jgi:uncharacterized protein YggU (UPF0235/DUF167 family)
VGTLTVRVLPRSSRPGIERRGGEVVVRVASPPLEGRATEEARHLLADRLGVPRPAIRLRAGERSRSKVFEVDGLTDGELIERIGGAGAR